jgi:nitrate reductase alpha subunit
VGLEPSASGDGSFRPGKFLTAAELARTAAATENASFKPVLIDQRSGQP